MTTPCHLKLRATNPALRLDRRYDIICQQGLFNSWLVTTVYGRYGQKGGTSKTTIFDIQSEAELFISKILKKRLNATKRIGCNYEWQN
jgi:hypothetical protein